MFKLTFKLGINEFISNVSKILPKDIIKIIVNIIHNDQKTDWGKSAKSQENNIIASTIFEYDSYGRIICNLKNDFLSYQKQISIDLYSLNYDEHSKYGFHKSCWVVCGMPKNGVTSPYKEPMFKTSRTCYVGYPKYVLNKSPEVKWMFEDPLLNIENKNRIVFEFMKSKCNFNTTKFYKILRKKREEID